MDISKMMKQAQKLQKEMRRAQDEIQKLERTFQAGGGAVQVTATGANRIKAVTIDPDVVDPDDVEGLEDLVLSAANGALQEIRKATEERMSSVTGGLNIPGLPGMP